MSTATAAREELETVVWREMTRAPMNQGKPAVDAILAAADNYVSVFTAERDARIGAVGTNSCCSHCNPADEWHTAKGSNAHIDICPEGCNGPGAQVTAS